MLTPERLRARLTEYHLRVKDVAARAGITPANLSTRLHGHNDPGLRYWGRVVGAYYALIAERDGTEAAERARRRDLLEEDRGLSLDVQRIMRRAVEAGCCTSYEAAEACGLTVEEWARG